MKIVSLAGRRAAAGAVLSVVAILAAVAADAENVPVTAANSNDNLVYGVNFPPETPPTIPINSSTDAATHGSFSAIVQLQNLKAGTVDQIVADAARGAIFRYRTPAPGAPIQPPVQIWPTSTSQCAGPAHPDGLSVDPQGNLYIVTNKQNDSTTSSVWVLKADPTNALGTGYAPDPFLVDGTFSGANGVRLLLDTAVAPDTTSGWSTGDLLVLVGNGSSSGSQQNSNNADVLVYKASGALKTVLAGTSCKTATSATGPDAILLKPTQFPAGEYPTGFDFWPSDKAYYATGLDHTTLLIATNAGHVLRYDFSAPGKVTSGFPQTFASGLGSGLAKLKVGLQKEKLYAYLTQMPSGSTGQIVRLGPYSGSTITPSPTSPPTYATVTGNGINGADAIAVARSAWTPITNCIYIPGDPAHQGCDLSGNVNPHQITLGTTTQLSGNIIESTCVVPVDPRATPDGGCDGTGLSAATISLMCPGFSVSIPPLLCGRSGVTGKGFALTQSSTIGVNGGPAADQVTGFIVSSQENPDSILPPPPGGNPTCLNGGPAVAAWAPNVVSGNEGVTVENTTDLLEMTGACDESRVLGRGASNFGVGFILNPNSTFTDTDPITGAQLTGMSAFVQQKLDRLAAAVTAAQMPPATTSAILSTGTDNLAQIQTLYSNQDYGCATYKAYLLDQDILADPNPTNNYKNGDPGFPNPWGEIRGRLANFYYTTYARLLQPQNPLNPLYTPNRTWPPGATDPAPGANCPSASSPTVTADNAVVAPNGSTTIRWSAHNVLSCAPLNWVALDSSGHPLAVQVLPVKGSAFATLGATDATFTVQCTDVYGALVQGSTTVAVAQAPVIGTFGYTGPNPVSTGATTRPSLFWTVSEPTAAVALPQCTVSAYVASVLQATYPAATSPWLTPAVNATSAQIKTDYQIACTNSFNQTAVAGPVTITTVPLPALSGAFSSTPTPPTVTAGNPVTFGWSATGASACSISGNGIAGGTLGATATATADPSITAFAATVTPPGLATDTAPTTTTYSVDCQNIAQGSTHFGDPQATAVPQATFTSFAASPSSVTRGIGSSMLSWAANPSGATCSIASLDGSFHANNLAATGSGLSTGTLTQSETYVLTCSNGLPDGVPQTDPVRVTVSVTNRVVAANSVGNQVYDVPQWEIAPPATNPLNGDGAAFGSFRSLVLAADPLKGDVDLVVADPVNQQILRYVAGCPVAVPVWKYAGSGPAHPDGLSLDSHGNLYVVTSKLNDKTSNGLWVLKGLAPPAGTTFSCGSGSTASKFTYLVNGVATSYTGFDGPPKLIDATFGSANGVKALMDTLVAPADGPSGLWAKGDVLVLVGNGSSSNSQVNSNDADVLVYSFATTITNALNGTAATGPNRILLTPSQFPSGTYPTGFDFLPNPAAAPGTPPALLIATTTGSILSYTNFSATTPPPPLVTGLGTALNKLKIDGASLVYVAQGASPAQLLRFTTSCTSAGCTLGAKSVATAVAAGAGTLTVNTPFGLAVTH